MKYTDCAKRKIYIMLSLRIGCDTDADGTSTKNTNASYIEYAYPLAPSIPSTLLHDAKLAHTKFFIDGDVLDGDNMFCRNFHIVLCERLIVSRCTAVCMWELK